MLFCIFNNVHKMKKGILIIACGHQYYGKMAAALAASIRLKSDIAIHLAYAGNALTLLKDNELKLFNSKSEIPNDFYYHAGQAKWIRTKMFIYDLSPFDETLYLDSDMLWLKLSPDELMNELSAHDITFPNHGVNETMWAKSGEIKAAYGEGKYYSIHSELIYFKKNDKVKRWFDTAKEVYDNLKVSHKVFAGAIPDELPFSIAGALTETYPHEDNYKPVYWGHIEKKHKQIYQIATEYWAFSMGGNVNTNKEKIIYDILSEMTYKKLGLQGFHKWTEKRNFLKERKNV